MAGDSDSSSEDRGSIESGTSGSFGDSFTETTHRSWGERLMSSLVGALVGLALTGGSIIGLFWNEGRAVQTHRSLNEGASAVVAIDPSKIDPVNEKKLIHASAPLVAAGTLRDPDTGLALPGLRLERAVETYQWVEKTETRRQKNVGGSEETVTTYTYVKEWHGGRVDSGRFKQPGGHQNPEPILKPATFVAEQATFGAFKPGQHVVRAAPGLTAVRPEPGQIEALRARYGVKVHLADDHIYVAANPQSPEVGDTRIIYRIVRNGPFSIVAMQTGSDLSPYQTRAGDRLLMVRAGTKSATEMFAAAKSDNTILTWVLRGVGALVMLIGFSLVLNPLVTLGDVVPFIGTIVGWGTGLVALFLTLIGASLTIAVAWFWYRPLVAVAVLAAGGVLAYLTGRLGASRKAAPTTSPVRA